MAQTTHEKLQEALAAADKSRLVLTARVLLTNRLWDLTEDDLRSVLHDLAHEIGHGAVYKALTDPGA